MNKRTLILETVCLFTFLILVNLSETRAITRTRDNYVYFTNDAHSVSFTVTNHCVSIKQPFKTPTGSPVDSAKYKKGLVGINIRAGRMGTEYTVFCILKHMFPSDAIAPFNTHFTFIGHHKPPSKLNFAVKGTLTINGKDFEQIILMQGHNVRNNWWFGGNKCLKSGGNSNPKEEVNCTASDGTKWCFIRASTSFLKRNSPNHIKVETQECATKKH